MSQRQIREWLARHPEALPRTLSDLVPFPMEFRRVMVGEVARETRVRLWREHLESFLRADSPLTAAQRQVVSDTIPNLHALFAAPAPNPTALEWEQKIATAFTRQEAAHVFASLGPPEPPEGIPLPPDALPTSAA